MMVKYTGGKLLQGRARIYIRGRTVDGKGAIVLIMLSENIIQYMADRIQKSGINSLSKKQLR